MLGLGGTRFKGSLDGSGYLGFSIGDARESVGFESVMNIISVSDDFLEEDSFSFKLHKTFATDTALAVGVEHALRVGDNVAPEQTYHYLAVSQVFHLPLGAESCMPLPLVATPGFCDGRFGNVGEGEDEFVGTSAFAAFSFMPHPRFSLLAEWLGEELSLGVSVVPVAHWPLTLTFAGLDVTEQNDSAALGFVF